MQLLFSIVSLQNYKRDEAGVHTRLENHKKLRLPPIFTASFISEEITLRFVSNNDFCKAWLFVLHRPLLILLLVANNDWSNACCKTNNQVLLNLLLLRKRSVISYEINDAVIIGAKRNLLYFFNLSCTPTLSRLQICNGMADVSTRLIVICALQNQFSNRRTDAIYLE